MRILFLAGGYPSVDRPYHGVFNARAVKVLSKEHDVSVCQIRYWIPGRRLYKQSIVEGIRHITLFLPFLPGNLPFISFVQIRLWSVLVYWLLRKKEELDAYDMVHSVSMEMAPIGSFVASKTGLKHFTQATGSDVYHYVPRWDPYWGKLNHWKNYVSCVICNSLAIQSELKQLYPDLKSEICYRGVNLEEFEYFRREQPKVLRFLFMGGVDLRRVDGILTDLKGGRFILEVWSELQKILPTNVELVICGPGSKGEYACEWQNALPNPSGVTLMGSIKPSEVPSLMRSCNVLLLPSESEGLPNVVMEAMSSGLLVVANAVGGVSELIKDGHNGFLMNVGEKQKWIATLKLISRDYFSFINFTKLSYDLVSKSFDSSTYGARLTDIYNSSEQV